MKVTWNHTMDDVSAFILVGGKSSRMGREKAFVEVKGETLVQRALQTARRVTPNVCILGDASRFSSEGPVIEDIFRGCGPLGGIHAALNATEKELNLFLAVDLPLIPAELLSHLVREARKNRAIVTLPQAGGRLQPLCAVYRREFSKSAQRALTAGQHKIDALFNGIEIRVVTGAELKDAGFEETVFHNLNTPQDLAEMNRL